MASLKALKVRIASVKSTQKITKAMKMVAAAKLRRAQEAAEAARPYAQKMEDVLASLAARVTVGPQSPRLLSGTGSDKRHLLVVATSERGLAGGFNTNIVRAARRHAEELLAAGKEVQFYLVGRKGRAPLARMFAGRIGPYHDLSAIKKLVFADAKPIADDLIARFEAGEYDVATLFYSRFKSVLAQEPTARQLIPAPMPEGGAADTERRGGRVRAERGGDPGRLAPAQHRHPGVPRAAGECGERAGRTHDRDGQRDEECG